MGERAAASRRTAEGVTPVTAQAHEPLDQANLESADFSATEGAPDSRRNLSGIKDRWGEANIGAQK